MRVATEVEPPRSGGSPSPSVQAVPCGVGDVVALLGETRASAVAGRDVGVCHERAPGEDGPDRGSYSRVVHGVDTLLAVVERTDDGGCAGTWRTVTTTPDAAFHCGPHAGASFMDVF